MSTTISSKSNPSLDAGRPATSGNGQEASTRQLMQERGRVPMKAWRGLRGAVAHARALACVLNVMREHRLLGTTDGVCAVDRDALATLIGTARDLLATASSNPVLDGDDAFDPCMSHTGLAAILSNVKAVFDFVQAGSLAFGGIEAAVVTLGMATRDLDAALVMMDDVYAPGDLGDECWGVGELL